MRRSRFTEQQIVSSVTRPSPEVETEDAAL